MKTNEEEKQAYVHSFLTHRNNMSRGAVLVVCVVCAVSGFIGGVLGASTVSFSLDTKGAVSLPQTKAAEAVKK